MAARNSIKNTDGIYQSEFLCTFSCPKTRKWNHDFYWMQCYVVGYLSFWREAAFLHSEMNCIKYLCNYTDFKVFFFFLIIVISASFVTCCMSVNTTDFLCQCNVHVLALLLFLFLVIFPRHCLMSCFKPRATDMCTVMIGVLEIIPRLWVDFCTLYGMEGLVEKKKSWIILVVLY